MILIITAFVVGMIIGGALAHLLHQLKEIDLSKPHDHYD